MASVNIEIVEPTILSGMYDYKCSGTIEICDETLKSVYSMPMSFVWQGNCLFYDISVELCLSPGRGYRVDARADGSNSLWVYKEIKGIETSFILEALASACTELEDEIYKRLKKAKTLLDKAGTFDAL